MADLFFFDTNILLYSVDDTSPIKREKAETLIEHHLLENDGVISTQVLQEFYVNAVKKLGLSPATAKKKIAEFQAFQTAQVTPYLINAGIDCSVGDQLSFWDGLILASANAESCSTIYSEDLNNGQTIGITTIVNPFASSI